MKSYTINQFKEALTKIGIKSGDVILVYSDIKGLGFLKEAKNNKDWLKKLFSAFIDIIGEQGTIVVPTYTTQVPKYDLPFIYEKTESICGVFSEYVRNLSNSLRSLHPVKSFTAYGKYKNEIINNTINCDYGYDTPIDRMIKLKAKTITFGLDLIYSIGIHHHLEVMANVPYLYRKILKWKPIKNGKTIDEIFILNARYLYFEFLHNFKPFVDYLLEKELINRQKVGYGEVTLTDMNLVFKEGIEKLKDNPHYFVKNVPEYIYGKVPFDGSSYEREKALGEKTNYIYYKKNKN